MKFVKTAFPFITVLSKSSKLISFLEQDILIYIRHRPCYEQHEAVKFTSKAQGKALPTSF